MGGMAQLCNDVTKRCSGFSERQHNWGEGGKSRGWCGAADNGCGSLAVQSPIGQQGRLLRDSDGATAADVPYSSSKKACLRALRVVTRLAGGWTNICCNVYVRTHAFAYVRTNGSEKCPDAPCWASERQWTRKQ